MENLNIVDLMCIGFEGFETMIYSKIKANPDYQPAQKTFDKHLDTIKNDIPYRTEVENSEITLETIARDTAYNEGFRMGMQFILGYVSTDRQRRASDVV